MPLGSPESAVTRSIEDRDYVRSLCESGDMEMLFQLISTIRREAWSYACRYCGNAEDADDVLQQADINALRGLRAGQFNAEQRLRPWYYSIITNAAIDHGRRNKRHHAALSIDRPNSVGDDGVESTIANLLRIDDDPTTGAEETDEMRYFLHAFGSISEQHQQILLERFVYGSRYREIAATMGSPLGTVKSRMHAAVQALRLEFDRVTASRKVA